MTSKEKNHPILVPVDFSGHSEAALLMACSLAECSKQPVIVLHVVHDPADMPGYYQRITKRKALVRMEDVAEEMLQEFIRGMIEKHPKVRCLNQVEQKLVVGLPVTKILQVAEKTKSTMVVMGSQGRTGLKHLMMGSKAEQVVHLCPVPVTIVKTESK